MGDHHWSYAHKGAIAGRFWAAPVPGLAGFVVSDEVFDRGAKPKDFSGCDFCGKDLRIESAIFNYLF
jgi:hypothetical protein